MDEPGLFDFKPKKMELRGPSEFNIDRPKFRSRYDFVLHFRGAFCIFLAARLPVASPFLPRITHTAVVAVFRRWR